MRISIDYANNCNCVTFHKYINISGHLIKSAIDLFTWVWLGSWETGTEVFHYQSVTVNGLFTVPEGYIMLIFVSSWEAEWRASLQCQVSWGHSMYTRGSHPRAISALTFWWSHLGGGWRPGLFLRSYNAQNSPHNEEPSSPKCQ